MDMTEGFTIGCRIIAAVWVLGFVALAGMAAWSSVNAQADALTAQHGSEAVAAMEVQ